MFSTGQEFTFVTVISNEDVRRASVLGASFQPLNHDPTYAERTHFGRPIAPDAILFARVTRLLESRLVGSRTHHVVTEQIATDLLDPVFEGGPSSGACACRDLEQPARTPHCQC